MSRSRLMAGLWLLGLVLAFQVGKHSKPNGLEGGIETRETRSETMRRSPADALRLGGSRALSSAVLRLETNAEFQSAFEELLPDLGDAESHDALFMLADVWASKDPAAATVWLAQLELGDVRNPYLFSALSQWASRDPAAAMAWLDSFPASVDASRDYLFAGLVRGLANADPDTALQMLLESPDSPERSGSMDFLIRAWTGVSLEHAFQQVAELPDDSGSLKERAIRKVTAGLTPEELELARGWAEGLSGIESRAATAGIAARWSQSDPVAAAEWGSDLANPQARTEALGEIGTRWGRIDPLAASAWLAERRGRAEMDLAARGIAWSVVGIDPDAAFAQVAGITGGPLRDETFEQVGRFWLSREPQKARAFLEQESPLPPAIRGKLLESFE